MVTDGQTATFSQFLRAPNEVVAATAHGRVLLTRRDDEDLVLMSAEAERRHQVGLDAAVAVVAAALAEGSGSFIYRLHQPFPWMTFLGDHEQVQFADELVELSRACAVIGRFEPLAMAIRQWKSTAEAYASGVTADGSDLEWLQTPKLVERPT